MTKQDQINALITLSIAKLLSEQATYLIGILPPKKRESFEVMLKKSDKFIQAMEKGMDEYSRETLVIMTDSMHDGIANLRSELHGAVK